ncbi:hypothetical protein [uncultured Stenotrophomonas sp.]|uniref:hypothetical protein n=1 Tax=uncultured Stenotrophomonas sp. TaxID=165438 RepID=UPI0025D7402F|nr:hypothetical protein [uncultured Stenotrophomonas sp.]
MSEYTPDTNEVRFNYTAYESEHTERGLSGADEIEFDAEFDLWLAGEIRKAKAEAWDGCAAVVEDIIIDNTGDIEPHERMLANPYREEEHSE